MSEIVDNILSGIDKNDDAEYWTVERLDALQIIDLRPGYWQDVSTFLDSIPVNLRLTFNDEFGSYFVDLASFDGAIVAKGLRLATGSDILDGLAFSGFGRLFIIDKEKKNEDPTYEGLGTRFVLCYLPKEYK